MNDSMGDYVVERLLSTFENNDTDIVGCEILILGVTFKENCADCRNSQVSGIINKLASKGANVHVFDPHVEISDLKDQGKFIFHEKLPVSHNYDAVVLAVPHKVLLEMGYKVLRNLGKTNCTFFDLKGAFDKTLSDFTF